MEMGETEGGQGQSGLSLAARLLTVGLQAELDVVFELFVNAGVGNVDVHDPGVPGRATPTLFFFFLQIKFCYIDVPFQKSIT